MTIAGGHEIVKHDVDRATSGLETRTHFSSSRHPENRRKKGLIAILKTANRRGGDIANYRKPIMAMFMRDVGKAKESECCIKSSRFASTLPILRTYYQALGAKYYRCSTANRYVSLSIPKINRTGICVLRRASSVDALHLNGNVW